MTEIIGRPGSDENHETGFFIPVDSQEFGRFLSGLLKSPRIIIEGFKDSYRISYEDLCDIRGTILHRVAEQHRSSLVSEEVYLSYSEGRFYALGSWKDFENHSHLGKDYCRFLTIEWIFLIDLPNTDVPQKQTIEIELSIAKENSTLDMVDLSEEFDKRYSTDKHKVEAVIRHTHVSFGNDIASLLRDKLWNFRILGLHAKKGSGIATFSLLSAFLLIWFGFSFMAIQAANLSLNESELQNLSSSEIITNHEFARWIMAIGLYPVGALAFASVIVYSAAASILQRPPAAIILSENDRAHYNNRLTKHRRRWAISIGSLTLALLVGALGSIAGTLALGVFS